MKDFIKNRYKIIPLIIIMIGAFNFTLHGMFKDSKFEIWMGLTIFTLSFLHGKVILFKDFLTRKYNYRILAKTYIIVIMVLFCVKQEIEIPISVSVLLLSTTLFYTYIGNIIILPKQMKNVFGDANGFSIVLLKDLVFQLLEVDSYTKVIKLQVICDYCLDDEKQYFLDNVFGAFIPYCNDIEAKLNKDGDMFDVNIEFPNEEMFNIYIDKLVQRINEQD